MSDATLVLERPTTAAVRSFGLTDRGKVRSANEDHFLVTDVACSVLTHHHNPAQTGHVFAVADGMGGHQAGEVASALGLRVVEDYLRPLLRRSPTGEAADEVILTGLQEAMRQADVRLFVEAEEHRELAGMGTTLTLAFAAGWRLFLGHVGDSRCYLLREGQLRQLTQDHTVAAAFARKGILRPEDVAGSRYRHVLTNALGGQEIGIEVELQRHNLEPGDILLLCSDGLTDMVSDERIATLLTAREPEQACERLVAEANEHGGRDNVTAIVARFEQSRP